MATEILAVGTTAAPSSDVVVAAGASLTVALKDAAGPTVVSSAYVDVLLKADNGEYYRVDYLNADRPGLVIVGAGTYRFSRRVGGSCGVFSG